LEEWGQWVALASPTIQRNYPDNFDEFKQRCSLPARSGGFSAVFSDPDDFPRVQAELERKQRLHYEQIALRRRDEMVAYLRGLDLAFGG
jgi:hypothetical protein